MVTLFQQKKVSEFHDYNLIKESEARGEARGMVKGVSAVAKNMLLADMSLEQISALTGLSFDEVEALNN